MTQEERDAIIEECAVKAEALERANRDWVRNSLWANIKRDTAAAIRSLKNTPTPVSHVARVLDLANKLAAQVDHCLLGYAIHRQNGLDIDGSMLELRVACNEFQSEHAAIAAAEGPKDV